MTLTFARTGSGRFRVDRTVGDHSPRFTLDELFVTPLDRVRDPMLDYLASSVGHMSGGMAPLPAPLEDTPVVVALELNNWFRFDEPGQYALRVRSPRVSEGPLWQPVPLDSNVLTFEILPRDEQWEAAELAAAVRLLEDRSAGHRVGGCQTLRHLATPAAVTAMVQRFGIDDGSCASLFIAGFHAAADREHVVRALEDGLRAPDVPVSSDYLHALAVLSTYLAYPDLRPPQTAATKGRLIANGPIAGRTDLLEVAYAYYFDILLSVLSDKRGAARASTIAQLERMRARYPNAALAVRMVRQELIASFRDLPRLTQQLYLEGFGWRDIAGADMLPVLTALVDDADASVSDAALRRLYEIDPVAGRGRILREIRAPRAGFSPRSLGLLPDSELPDLADTLAANAERDPDGTRLWLVHRYAPAAVAPRLLATLSDRVNSLADCSAQSAYLAYMLRALPENGAALLDRALASRERTGCYERVLGTVSSLYMSLEVEFAALAHLDDADPDVVVSAIETLGSHGSAGAQPRLRERFERWAADWRGRGDLLGDMLARHPQSQLESALLQALGKGQGWLSDSAEIAWLQSHCVTSVCREAADRMRIDADSRVIRVTAVPVNGTIDIRVAQYWLTSIDALRRKLAQFPSGTRFALSVSPSESASPAIPDEIRRLAEDLGMRVEP